MTVYLDASVAVSLLLEDVHTPRARRLVSNAGGLIVSDLTSAEFSSAVAIQLRVGNIDKDQARGAFASFDSWRSGACDLVEVMPADIRAAERMIRNLKHAIRVPDATHIAIAARLDAALATFDKAMAQGALALGLQLADAQDGSPGQP